MRRLRASVSPSGPAKEEIMGLKEDASAKATELKDHAVKAVDNIKDAASEHLHPKRA